jgi:hypothetical protein
MAIGSSQIIHIIDNSSTCTDSQPPFSLWFVWALPAPISLLFGTMG